MMDQLRNLHIRESHCCESMVLWPSVGELGWTVDDLKQIHSFEKCTQNLYIYQWCFKLGYLESLRVLDFSSVCRVKLAGLVEYKEGLCLLGDIDLNENSATSGC